MSQDSRGEFVGYVTSIFTLNLNRFTNRHDELFKLFLHNKNFLRHPEKLQMLLMLDEIQISQLMMSNL